MSVNFHRLNVKTKCRICKKLLFIGKNEHFNNTCYNENENYRCEYI